MFSEYKELKRIVPMNRWWPAFITFLLGLVVVPAFVYLYISYGRPPVSVSDAAFPMEKSFVRKALHRRIDSEMEKAPFDATPDNRLAGAKIYREQCAFCHGGLNDKSSAGTNMYPSAPRLWQPHQGGVVGVSDDPVGETYWRVKNGIRLTGMPSYQHLLNEQQMWQVSLLLSKANEPLSDDLRSALEGK